MSPPLLSPEALARALGLRDLTDPAQGPHCMQALLDTIVGALRDEWRCELRVHRSSPLVSVSDNYDVLGYPADGAAREARYTRYVSASTLLRTQTSALVPPLLRALAPAPPRDVLLVCPGLVYRRDAIDRLHTGEPHQVDLWRVTCGAGADGAALRRMVELVVAAALPGREWRAVPATHPYTLDGLQLDVRDGADWVEIGECGRAHPALLGRCGLPLASGLAMGLGLDRLVMLRKGLPDMRLLRDGDPRVATQLLDLSPWRPVSKQPAVTRDLSLAMDAGDEVTAEALGDRVREALGERAGLVESLAVLSSAPAEALPAVAADRLGIAAGQHNVLLRIVLRAFDRTLSAAECNELRDDLAAALHRGTRHAWAGRRAREAAT